MGIGRKTMAAAACATAAATAWCAAKIEREDWTVRSPRLPAPFDGLRLTLVTDLHGAELGRGNEALLKAVRKSRPDYIAICGDLVDERTDLGIIWPLLDRLQALAPVFFVPGNHECRLEDPEKLLQQLRSRGIRVLRNEYVLLQKGGREIVLAGADDPESRGPRELPEDLLRRIRARVPGDPYIVMLYHRNNSLEQWAALRPDLVLTGHGHGGVVRVPGVGGLISVERTLFPKDSEGLYRKGRTVLAVSRGLGGLRVWNRPHLPTIRLKCR